MFAVRVVLAQQLDSQSVPHMYIKILTNFRSQNDLCQFWFGWQQIMTSLKEKTFPAAIS